MLAPTGYEITEVESGEEALTAIAKQRPDLILMDIQLPTLRSMPIIAVKSYALSGEENRVHAKLVASLSSTLLQLLNLVMYFVDRLVICFELHRLAVASLK
jgi:CheY-like chemotaxis protein